MGITVAYCSVMACILPEVQIYLLYKNVFSESTENYKDFYHCQVGVTCNFVQLKAPFPVTSIAMLLRPCLGIAVPCFQSLKNIQDYCMLKQLKLFLSYFILLSSWTWHYIVTLPSFEIDFLVLIQFIRLWK